MQRFFSTSVVAIIIADMTLMSMIAVMSCNKTDTTTNAPAISGSPTIHSVAVTSAPVIDGDASDAAWSAAAWTTVHMKPISVPNNTLTNEFDLQIKSVHTADEIFFLVTYPDAEADETPSKLTYQGGDPASLASWKNANNGQDGVSFMWDMMLNGAPARDAGGKFTDSSYGCTAACHVSKNYHNAESGMFPDSGEVDLWHWCAGTTNPQGYADDEFAVGADATSQAETQRRFTDANDVTFFARTNYNASNLDFPSLVAGGANNGLDKAKFLWIGSAMTFNGAQKNPATGSAFMAGEFVPGWGLHVLSPIGSELDVRAKGKWSANAWTVELKRARTNLTTDQDVQFDASTTAFPFSIAVHENARKYTDFEYRALTKFQPPHYGCVPRKLVLKID